MSSAAAPARADGERRIFLWSSPVATGLALSDGCLVRPPARIVKSRTVQVKNTFIECELSDDDDGPPMVATKSCPVSALGSDSSSAAGLEAVTPKTLLRLGGSEFSRQSTVEGEARFSGPSTPDGAGREEVLFGDGAQEVARAMLLASEQVAPLEERVPEDSVGSVLHGTGECKPCAWFWRPQGCQNGSECLHCHLCPRSAMKERRKNKVEAIRAQGSRTRCRRRR